MSGRIASLILALVFLTGQQPVRSQSRGSSNGFDLVDKTGNIRKPADFRDLYQALGVYTPVDLNNNTEMHYTTTRTHRRAQLSITARLESSQTEPY